MRQDVASSTAPWETRHRVLAATMTRMRSIRTVLSLALFGLGFCALSSLGLRAQTPELTLEWMTGAGPRRAAEVARFMWRRDNRAVIYDVRQPAAERAFEILDPVSGARTRLAAGADVLTALNRQLADRDRLTALRWPDAIDESGDRALYTLAGEVFVVDLATGAATPALTHTAGKAGAATFSPDGRRLAFVSGHDLYAIDIASKRESRLTRDGSDTILNGTLSWLYWEEIFGRRDTGYWWSDDSRAIAFLQTDESPVALSHFVDDAPTPPRLLTQRYPFAGGANPKVRVGIIDLDRPSAVRWVVLPSSAEYVTRVQWLPGSRRVAVEAQTRDMKRLDVYLADRSGGVARPLLADTDPGWVNVNDDLYFRKDGTIVRASERDGYAHLYRFSADGALQNQITKGPWAIVSNAGGVPWLRQAVAGIDEASDWIYFTSLEASSVERQLYRVHSDGTGRARISAERGEHAVRFSPDARYYFDVSSNSATMPSLTLHKADGTLVQTISPARPEAIASFGMHAPELTTIPAADGFAMPAEIWKPIGAGRHPVILYVYGGASSPVVEDGWTRSTFWSEILLREGFGVVFVDNRTATGISKTLEDLTVGTVGDSETRDLVDAVHWLKGQPWVDPSRVGVWGWSGGGTMTLNLLTRSKEFAAGIAVAPVTDWRFYDTRIAEMFLGRPEEHPREYDATSLLPRAGDLHGRLLLVHGTYDDNVHPQNEQRFIDALIAKGITFDLMVYPMRQHGIDDGPAQLHLYRTMLEFWKRTLRP
jgi:dipeptidyl-peptidase-4